MTTNKPSKTIDQVFAEFLAEQEARLSEKTFREYESIIDLLRSYLESYWPDTDDGQYGDISDAGGTYCSVYGPDEIAGSVSDFLQYFMPRKVMASKSTMKAAGTVTKKLLKWLADKGYVTDKESLETARDRAGEAARDLPVASDLLDLLADWADENAPDHFARSIEDHFIVARIEPGKLWLEPLTSGDSTLGPVPVPGEVSENCRVGWDISGTLAKTRRGWSWLEVWNVSP